MTESAPTSAAEQEKRPRMPFGDALTLVEEKLKDAENKATSAEPVDVIVDEKSIEEEDLKRYAVLPRECLLWSNPKGERVLSTGSPKITSYDFDRRMEELSVLIKDLPPGSDERTELEKERRGIEEAKRVPRMTISRRYTAHQHPNKVRIPSMADARASSYTAGTGIDIVFTEEGVVLYKADPAQCQSLELDIEMTENTEGRDITREERKQLMENVGVIKGYADFGSDEMKLVVAFMRGDKEWADIKDNFKLPVA